ncbi:MAG TPA: ATP synthase delta/epsilon chain alpha-helix domain-containing protein, partial [Desulfobaccales bacterium]|nr:ATP synthase delta/epsilon chain alpha-helix domain-containing protein [Desulfobaccales bacterium]
VTASKVTIVAESAESGREIDIERARRAAERAEKRLGAAKTEEIDYTRAEAALRRSMVRMKVAGR